MNKKLIIALVAFVLIIAAVVTAYFVFSEKATEGAKTITITVIDDKGESKEYKVNTDALYLNEAMRDAGIEYSGADGMVDTINGVKAVYEENSSYWAFYVNDGYCNYGIYEQPVEDGDAFKIEYTVYEE